MSTSAWLLAVSLFQANQLLQTDQFYTTFSTLICSLQSMVVTICAILLFQSKAASPKCLEMDFFPFFHKLADILLPFCSYSVSIIGTATNWVPGVIDAGTDFPRTVVILFFPTGNTVVTPAASCWYQKKFSTTCQKINSQ